jgi:hypothetical protein
MNIFCSAGQMFSVVSSVARTETCEWNRYAKPEAFMSWKLKEGLISLSWEDRLASVDEVSIYCRKYSP